MEESFRVRVDKVFGSLSGPSSATPWSLSDEEMLQNNRSSFSGEKEDGKGSGDEIGLDCTLDYEEEEDEFDKVAVDSDRCDRVYMRSIDLGYGIDAMDSFEFDQACRDPRANHSAARVRLMEDADDPVLKPALKPVLKPILKPVLKAIEGGGDKSSKRVRFHHQCNLVADDPIHQSQTKSEDDDPIHQSQSKSEDDDDQKGLPDYLRNPTAYTRYTLDSSNDMDEATNRKAFTDLFNLLNKKPIEPPQLPLTFTPRNRHHSTKSASLSVAARDDVEMDTAEDDNTAMETVRINKRGRHYRMRTLLHSDTAP